jgi:hypothetical protein
MSHWIFLAVGFCHFGQAAVAADLADVLLDKRRGKKATVAVDVEFVPHPMLSRPG